MISRLLRLLQVLQRRRVLFATRLQEILTADTTLFEIGLALYTTWEGIAVFRASETYNTSPAFAPIAPFLPYWIVGGVPATLGLLWLIGTWRKGLLLRFAATGIGLLFWLFLTAMFYSGVPHSILFINTLVQALLQVFMLWHLWAEWLLQQKADAGG